MKTRSEIAEPINLILVLIKDLLAIQKEAPVVLSAFRALKAIAVTLCSGEEGSMAELVPYVLSASKEKYSASEALGALAAMSYVYFLYLLHGKLIAYPIKAQKLGPVSFPSLDPSSLTA